MTLKPFVIIRLNWHANSNRILFNFPKNQQ